MQLHLLVLIALFSGLQKTDAVTFSCDQYIAWGRSIFQCANNLQCFPAKYECDSIIDCFDFSDEDHCEAQWAVDCVVDFSNKFTRNGEALQRFQCSNGQCILGCQRCDGTIHCVDFTDEIGCTSSEILNPPPCN